MIKKYHWIACGMLSTFKVCCFCHFEITFYNKSLVLLVWFLLFVLVLVHRRFLSRSFVLGRSIIVKKGDGSQVKESTDSSTTLEDDDIKGKVSLSLVLDFTCAQ